MPLVTAVKIYGYLLKCDRRRALAAGEAPEDVLIFPPLPEGHENQQGEGGAR